MGGLNHYFAVMPKDSNYVIDNNNPNKIIIDDGIILYTADTMDWITGFNPSDQTFVNGLCYYGITCFDNDLIHPFQNLMVNWRNIFSNAPDDFILTGNWQTFVDNPDKGHYEKILVNRDMLLGQLDILIGYCKQVSHNENLVLVHNGI
ncbi:MAG: hypothetical protein Q4B79_06840 [Moraxella sp.]|uniref:hypothetical protein n=1 Tax=Moraxella sp. TaxID=479 RepID=UPI0026DAEC22|nr:hypothetical protein [Moraxella sp.]MDO4450654.1 hypothetical protein [Moraxella sp.]